jgi:enoyl-CoA hydratase/carnithine racemase
MSRLLISREERVLRLTLNYVEKRNVLEEDLCRDLVEALRYAGKDQGVGCILVDAQGPIFCAGFDFDELLGADAAELTAVHEELLTFGVHYHKPIVAAVQGPCFGAGVGLVANCHVAVAARGAQFGLTEIRVGHWPFVAHRAVALAIGERRTVELSLTGRIFSAADAAQYGLVHELAEPDELDNRATQIARLLATASQETLRRGLDFVQKSREMSWTTAGRLADEYVARTLRSADFFEGNRAATEKRRPAWPSLTPDIS